MRLLSLPVTSWTSGWGETSFFKGKLSCYPTECSFSPSALAHSPFSIQLKLVYIPPQWFLGGRRVSGAGGDTGGNRAFFFLSETTFLVQQNNVNSAEKALIMQNGWTHHAFFCNNPRSPSPGKFLPLPSPANVFPLSNDIGGTPGTFYTLIACQPHLIGSIAFLFPFYLRTASPSPFCHLRNSRAGSAGKEQSVFLHDLYAFYSAGRTTWRTRSQRGLSRLVLAAFLP